ncbi:MAG: ligand-gated channel [Arenimonas sp. SCN 70-307]|uniref:TonB-dependent receptor plug domain-containing protein n=1 Tax=Arenimonas sp. SCN 70-307 TaxID=1660089 RepID=UPI000869F073|nr:TonB-dependent receptor [Arenimonas sp. SCN 70-307]ODS63073.1 MAG: ligand-gated channel [Arenimonas sp. SCN 70-307]
MRRNPLSLALLAALATAPVHAQSTPQEEGAETKVLDSIIVTGTRVADRTAAESLAPIDILTVEALTATGTPELATALARALPSLNFPRPAINDGTDAVRPAQLRGLSPDHVLVLVNGKRYHSGSLVNVNGSQGRSSSPVDLNTIPMSAIERVEVLRDGASAQYGSDAIAGVINIVLKGSRSGGSLNARHGQYSAGDGAISQFGADAGFAIGEDGFIHFSAQVGDQEQTNRARPFIGTPSPTTPPLGVVVQRQGDPAVEFGSFTYNGEVAFSDTFSIYSTGIYTERDSLSNGFFRPAGDARNIPSIYPNGFLPQINNVSTDKHLGVGVRGTMANGTSVDVSYTYGSNELTFDILNTLNRSLGPTSPTEFYAGLLGVEQDVFNVDLSNQLDWGMAYPVTLSYGLEWRQDAFRQGPGEPLSYALGTFANLPGSQVFPGFKPSDGGNFDRQNVSLYAGLEGDVTEQLSLGVAARYEDYSDFGTTSNWKLSSRYAFSETVALRATVSTGFRAPSLQQQFFQSTATNFIGGVPFDIVTFRVTNPAAIALGAEPLRPEESTNISLGLVLQPADGLYVTIDAYQIEVDDRITLSENLTSTAVRNFLNANGFPGVGGGRYFTNAIDTTTRGVDVVGTYAWQLENSQLDLTLGYNYNKTEIDRIAANPAALNAIDPTALRFGRVELGRFEVGSPRDKFQLGGVYNVGNWSLAANATRYGEFTVLFGNNPADTSRDQTYGAEWTLDLSGTYKLGSWAFTLGADNVLDSYPDEVLFANSTSGQLPYSGSSPFGFNGAYLYANAKYSW